LATIGSRNPKKLLLIKVSRIEFKVTLKHSDPMRLIGPKNKFAKKICLTLDPPQRPQTFGLENALIRGFPKTLNSNTAPNIVLANVGIS